MKAKRIISCILMLLMLASLIPAGFAATSGPYNPNPDPDPGNYVVPDDNSQQPSAGDNGNSSARTHNWQNLKTELEATCTSYGMATQVCYDCGATQTVYTNMLPHSWGEWEITARATDHTAGERQRTCEVCGKTESEKYYLEGTVLPGSSGEEVEELQDLLNENGIPAPKDGEYGDATREAVREAQRRNGLEVDGIAWLQTVNHLQHRWGDWEVLREPTLTKPGLQHRICEICGYDEKEEFIDGLGPGARGDFVRDLQEILAALGYYDGRIDGDYGDGVRQAVERWQRDHGMEPTGIVDRDTLNQIIEEYLDFIRQQRQDDEEDGEEPEDEDEPPEDDGKDEDEFEKSTSEIPDGIQKQALGVTAPKKAACHVEYLFLSEPENGEYYQKGESIKYLWLLVNDGDINITAEEFFYCREDNLGKQSNAASVFIEPGSSMQFSTPLPGGGRSFKPGYLVKESDLISGEYNDAVFAEVVFENGEIQYPKAELHVQIGSQKSKVSASFWARSLTEPKNGLFYTEGEQVNYDFVLENTCSTGLNYKVYDNHVVFTTPSYAVNTVYTYKPAKGYLEPLGGATFGLTNYKLPHTVTAKECDEEKYIGRGEIAACTFDNGAKRTYIAIPEFPCGIEEPGATVEIVETSHPENDAYYVKGEEITYDVVLSNTGNLNMFHGEVYLSVEGSAPASVGSVSLAPGAS
ncbi:MAG: peptidoglycan-binding protein, partial [Oscillospiraceae bacterium]|nr:peptidoglycan-binding protein [Oscillospiraceae bacterium]